MKKLGIAAFCIICFILYVSFASAADSDYVTY